MGNEERVRCIYKTQAGFIQLDFCSLSVPPQRLFTEQRSSDGKMPLRGAFINCALHPTLTAQSEKNDLLSKSIQRATLLKKRHWNKVHQITENDRFCLDMVVVNIHLPHIYLGCYIVPPANEKIIDLATAAAHQDFQVLDSVITLLQNHFPFCKCIYLVVKTIPDPNMEIISPLADHKNAGNMLNWDEKALTRVVQFLEEKVLQRVDDLYRSMIQQQPGLLKTETESKHEGLFFLPSPCAWTPFLEKARRENAIIRGSSMERDQLAVWRAVESSDAKEMKREGDAGYYVATDVMDYYHWSGIEPV